MKFSLPSIQEISRNGLETLKRFPFVIFSALSGTLAAIWMIGSAPDQHNQFFWLSKIIFIGGLGISSFFGIAVMAEKLKLDKLKAFGLKLLLVILLLLYYGFSGRGFTEGPTEVWYRFALFFLAAHLFVAFAPFLQKGETDEFWEYNKILFLRILLSVLYSGVLFAGLSIAMLSTDTLLDFSIDGDRYFQLFVFLAGIFNTWFFLAGVPEFNSGETYIPVFPKGLKIFVQYVLIPLVTVYIIILYLYTGKIILQWELPNGWVSNLVLSFSIAGILSLLLLYPIRNKAGNRWIQLYSKGYYAALIPLIGLLILSIWVRISEYGVTVNRFFVATLGVWLTGIVLYFLINRQKNIKVIPISLCLVALGISFGPQGAFSVSERSQLGRFEKILRNHEMLNRQDKVQPASQVITFEATKELSSIARYVTETHGADAFSEVFFPGF